MTYIKATKIIADYAAKLASGKKPTPNQNLKHRLAQVWLKDYLDEKAAERALFVKHVRG